MKRVVVVAAACPDVVGGASVAVAVDGEVRLSSVVRGRAHEVALREATSALSRLGERRVSARSSGAVFGWSVDRLDERERAALRRALPLGVRLDVDDAYAAASVLAAGRLDGSGPDRGLVPFRYGWLLREPTPVPVLEAVAGLSMSPIARAEALASLTAGGSLVVDVDGGVRWFPVSVEGHAKHGDYRDVEGSGMLLLPPQR